MNLLNVLVADDEDIIREGLCAYIPWEEHGFRLVGSAHDGRQAWELLHSTPVDLLVTDIQMPDLNGIELIGRLAEEKSNVTVLMITGYDDFDYAQQALRSRIVCDYLLKPINRKEFIRLLDKLYEEITAKKREITLPALPQECLSLLEAQEAKRLRQVAGFVQQGEAGQAGALWAKFWQGCLDKGYPRALLMRCCWELTMQLDWALAQWGLRRPEQEDPLLRISQFTDLEQLGAYGSGLIQSAAHQISPQADNQLTPIVRACVEIIRTEYSDPALSLQSLSERMSVSANYLSACFKKEVGIGFLKYLNNLRIAKAQELLQDLHLRAYEVANRVGVEDQRYFSRLFKELTGMSPSGYRAIVRQNKQS